MNASVQLNDEPLRGAIEIKNEPAYGMLCSEFQPAKLAILQRIP